jgi:hypothetical protein
MFHHNLGQKCARRFHMSGMCGIILLYSTILSQAFLHGNKWNATDGSSPTCSVSLLGMQRHINTCTEGPWVQAVVIGSGTSINNFFLIDFRIMINRAFLWWMYKMDCLVILLVNAIDMI